MANFIPKEIVLKAKQVDLLTYFINTNPNELVKKGIGTYSLKKHDSVIISNGLWHRFSTNEAGKTALDYLMKVEKMTLQEAVKNIINYSTLSCIKIENGEKNKTKKLIIPQKASNNKIIIEYLKNRGIDEDIIKYCIDNSFIYQEMNTNNVVFLGYDYDNRIQYAGCRSCNEKRIMRDAKGSSKEFSFKLLSKIENNSVHIFESSIDLLSYATLLKIKGYDYHNENLLSLSGVYQPNKNITQSKIPIAIQKFLMKNKNIQNIILHLDHDRAGRESTKALITVLSKYNIYDVPAPIGKDINDYLCFKLGLKKRQEIEKYKIRKVQNRGEIIYL